jgi:uncharacterized protein (TIGR02118 family)
MPGKYVFVVYTRPTVGQEDEFNRWYDAVHIPDVLKIPGFVSAERFSYQPVDGTAESSHPYLALYTVETDDIAATQAALTKAANTAAMPISGALDLPAVKATYYAALKT